MGLNILISQNKLDGKLTAERTHITDKEEARVILEDSSGGEEMLLDLICFNPRGDQEKDSLAAIAALMKAADRDEGSIGQVLENIFARCFEHGMNYNRE
ncbi:MAG: hypothetical protein ACOYUZ_05060 [Patescibacteria group bacterium]